MSDYNCTAVSACRTAPESASKEGTVEAALRFGNVWGRLPTQTILHYLTVSCELNFRKQPLILFVRLGEVRANKL